MRSSSSAEVASEHDERFEETPILSYQLSMRDIFPAPVDLAVIDIVLPETSNEATFATPSSSKYIIAGDASLPTIESTQLTQTPIESDTYHMVQLTAYYLDLEENAIHEEEDDEQVLHFQITMEDLVSAPSESVTEIILDAGTMMEAQSEIDFEDWQDLIWLGEAMCNMFVSGRGLQAEIDMALVRTDLGIVVNVVGWDWHIELDLVLVLPSCKMAFGLA